MTQTGAILLGFVTLENKLYQEAASPTFSPLHLTLLPQDAIISYQFRQPRDCQDGFEANRKRAKKWVMKTTKFQETIRTFLLQTNYQ